MKWNRFQAVSGTFVEPIPGQSRIGYSMSDTADFYDMVEWSKKGGFGAPPFRSMTMITAGCISRLQSEEMCCMEFRLICRACFGFCRETTTKEQ